MDKNFWKKLNKEWNKKPLYDNDFVITLTGFFPLHSGGSALNCGETGVLHFGKQVIEANGVFFQFNKYASRTVEVYLSAKRESNSHCLFEFRKNGKTVWIDTQIHESDIKSRMTEFLGKDHDFTDEYDLTNGLYGERYEKFLELLKKNSTSLVSMFRFSNRLVASYPHSTLRDWEVENAEEIKNGLRFRQYNVGTYNALPFELTIEKKELKTVSLGDIGVERAGYYSWHYRCSILPEQENEVKEFVKLFK